MDVARQDLGATLAHATADGDVLLLVSGGSALALLADVPEGIAWSRVTLGVVDERYGVHDADRNDLAVAATPLAQAVAAVGGTVLVFPHDAPDVVTAAGRYETLLRAWHAAHPDGQVIATFGMGPDGHTAGIMPYPEDPERFAALFDDPAHWVVGYDATGKNPLPLRVTATGAYLRTHVAHAVVLATGVAKAGALARVVTIDDDSASDLATTPARLLRELPQTTLYTDLPA